MDLKATKGYGNSRTKGALIRLRYEVGMSFLFKRFFFLFIEELEKILSEIYIRYAYHSSSMYLLMQSGIVEYTRVKQHGKDRKTISQTLWSQLLGFDED